MPLAPAASGDYLYKDFVNTGTGTTELDSSGSEVALKVMATASSGYSTAPQGDLTFENGVRAKEEADGLVFMNPQGTKIALLDAQGNFHIKGDIIKDL
jgi:hypothetical protein